MGIGSTPRDPGMGIECFGNVLVLYFLQEIVAEMDALYDERSLTRDRCRDGRSSTEPGTSPERSKKAVTRRVALSASTGLVPEESAA